MSTHATDRNAIPEVERTRWRIDPTRSSVEFHAPNFWGLATVKGLAVAAPVVYPGAEAIVGDTTDSGRIGAAASIG